MGSTVLATADIHRGEEVTTTWRIVDTDNFGGDYPDERFVAINIRSKEMAEFFVNAWNEHLPEHTSRILKVVEHREIVYKLQPGFEP